jgi:hypothetical protein
LLKVVAASCRFDLVIWQKIIDRCHAHTRSGHAGADDAQNFVVIAFLNAHGNVNRSPYRLSNHTVCGKMPQLLCFEKLDFRPEKGPIGKNSAQKTA